MDDRAATQGEKGLGQGASPQPFRLPLVSLIVVNFNYGRYLKAAVDSIFAQTYPNIECVVVDNGSTDETDDVLRVIAADYPEAKIIRRAANDGQTTAAMDGLKATTGAYVIFVDADDVLLPHGVDAHIFVHLSLRVHVGFTSGDVLQSSNDQLVLGTEEAFNRFFMAGRGFQTGALRPYVNPFDESWPPGHLDRALLERVRLVPPMINEWVWSPTSGNCFRRDALVLFADNPGLRTLQGQTDLYFCSGINAVIGSALIDAPVAIYRIHGDNIFSKRPQLHHVLCYQPETTGEGTAQGKAVLLDHLVERADRFVNHGWEPIDYARLLRRLDCFNPDPMATRPWARRSRLAWRLVEKFDLAAAVLGPWITRGLLLRCGAPFHLLLRGRKPK
jgi:glycosyltransferase involved in cell wall biosynthesis